MRLDLKPYPAYKDSGVEWLGEVPEHWEVRRIKDVARLKSGDAITSAEIEPAGAYAVYGGNGVRGFTSQYTHDGDFVLIGRQGALCGNINYASGRFWASEHAVVAHPRGEFNLVWFGELLRTMNLNQYSIAAAQPGLAVERIQDLSLPVPPVEEQTRIGRYLDYMDRRIRRYIRAKQKLIELLEEQKQVIIHRAVTGQIDVRTGKPYPAYKDSGVEWLGQVPEHWEVLPLKRVAWFKSGAGFPTSEQGRPNSEIPFLRVSDMTRPGNERWIEVVDSTVTMQTARRLGAFVFPENAVIFPKVGGALLTNKRRLLRRASCIDNNLMGCVVRHADVEFMFTVLQQLDLGRLAKPGPVPAIGEGDVRGIRVAIPPSAEQAAIVRYLDDATANTDTAIAHARREIELLREYRTRLIADVVTGKLDVREVAANLRDEAEEPESLTNEDLLADEDEVEEAVAEEAVAEEAVAEEAVAEEACPEELDA